MAARVLVVDDHPDVRTSLVSLCDLWGYDAADAEDGEEALAVAAAFLPDVAILDLGLGGPIGATELTRRLREYASDGIFVIVLTGWIRAADREAAIRAGAQATFLKPVDLDVLRRTLARATARRVKGGIP